MPTNAHLLLATLAAFVVAWGATGLLIAPLRRAMLDVPNDRSSHSRPTPRGGGLGILAGFAAGLCLLAIGRQPLIPAPILAGAAAMAALGFADDRYRLSAGVRLLVQALIAAAVIAAAGGVGRAPAPTPLGGWPLGVFDPLVTAVWLVGVVNLYNFLDGIDGFAAGQGLVAGALLAVLFAGSPAAGMLWIVAAACGGFLIHNWNPAAVFLGDVGSCFLGFLFAAAPLALEPSERPLGVFAVALALWFFLADGAYTLLLRAARGEPIWKPHRSHLYQRFTRTGLSHGRTVLLAGGLFSPVALLALWAHRQGGDLWWLAFGAAIASFGLYRSYLVKRERELAAQPAGEPSAAASAGEVR